MPSELVTVRFERYRSPKGEPTCAADAKMGEVCRLLRSQRYGSQDVCAMDTSGAVLERRGDGMGFLVPGERCILWGRVQ